MSAVSPTAIAPLIGSAIPALTAIPALAGVAPAALTGPAFSTLIGPLAPSFVFAAPLVLPFLFSSFFQPSPEEQSRQQFTEAASLPRGTDLAIFGLPGMIAPDPDAPAQTETAISVFSKGRVDQSINFQLGAREALSFVPSVAARGEARIAKFLAQAIPTTFRQRAFGIPGARESFEASQRVTVTAARNKSVADARTAQIGLAVANPFFNIVANAVAAGRIPGTEISKAALSIPVAGGQSLGVFIRSQAAGIPAAAEVPPPVATTTTLEQLRAQVTASRARGENMPAFIRNREARQAAAGAARRAEFEQFLSPPFQARPEVTPVPTVNTSIPITGGAGGFLGGFGTVLSGLGAGIGSIISAATPLVPSILAATTGRGAVAMPGGAPIMQAGQFPGQFADPRLVQAQQAAFGLNLPSLVPDFLGAIPTSGGACISPTTRATTRLPSRVDVPTIDAGGNTRFTSFKNMGKPVLWSGDIAACKRVKRIGSKVRRAVGGGR